MSSPAIEKLFEQLQADIKRGSAEPLFGDDRPVLVYGAGNVGKDVFRLLKGRGVRVEGFLDRQAKPGAAWENVPILLPDDPTLSAGERKLAHVVIGIFNYAAEIPPVIQLLRSLGYGRISTFLDLHDQFPTELGDRYWLTARRFYLDKKEAIIAGYELMSDDESRELYAAILRFRLTRDYEALPTPVPDQYFPAGLPPWPTPFRLVDCGAYDGDTLRQLSALKLPIEAIAAFEPDPINFPRLAQSVRGGSVNPSAAVTLFPCGVSSVTKQIRFSSGQGTSSSASKDGDIVIQCVALDDALPGFHPSLIKMDIEGAEIDALLGARRTIENDRPGLAICVYHRPDDLWEIPLLSASWLKGGRHYLRAHAHCGFELIYYWMP